MSPTSEIIIIIIIIITITIKNIKEKGNKYKMKIHMLKGTYIILNVIICTIYNVTQKSIGKKLYNYGPME